MALKTVDRNAGIRVTCGAKVLVARNARKLTVRSGIDVTIDTLFKAMLFGADASVHRFIALMKDKFHVTATHDLSRLHTLLRLGLGYLRYIWIGYVTFCGQGLAQKGQSPNRYSNRAQAMSREFHKDLVTY